MKSIETTMIELNHLPPRNDGKLETILTEGGISVLKIDVEGAEWDALAAMFSSERMAALLKAGFVKQMLLEWHWDPESR
jgi:hypothetical protein